MKDNILEIRHLKKCFRGRAVVWDVSFEIPRNCVYGILGPNGAGKSTLMKMISGILKPEQGGVVFDGHLWTRKDLQDIGALIETPPIYENLTAYENLKVRSMLLGIGEERIREVLEIVGLSNTGKKRSDEFSLGMKQRLGIAIALLNQPKLLILDEPMNGLDPIGIQEFREMIRKFPEQGMTVMISSHILSEMEQVADYVAIMANGRLGYEGKMPKGEHLEELFIKTVKREEEALC